MFRPRMMMRSLIRPVTNSATILQESQVSGPQERARVPSAEGGSKDVLGLLGPLPVALRHARPLDPDLADAIPGKRNSTRGIGDHDVMAGNDLPARGQ